MIQMVEFRILSCFFGQDSCRFTEVCRAGNLPTDLGGYYIRRLVQGGFLIKGARGTYSLTSKGKQQLAISYGKNPFINRPRLHTMIVAQQGGKYIALQRTRQPFIGIVEWPAGTVLMGERLDTAVRRIAFDRLGVKDEPVFRGLFRRIDMYNDMVFDDKLFAVHTLTVPTAVSLNFEHIAGKNLLLTRDELYGLENPSKSLMDIFAFTTNGQKSIEEYTYQLEADDLFFA